MSEAEELREAIGAAKTQRECCARRAHLLEQRCRGLRDDNPNDPRLEELSKQIDALDELHDRISDDIGRLKNGLHEIEGAHALRCLSRGLNLSEY